MATELRRDYHDRLAELHRRIEGMGRVVSRGIVDATVSFLEADGVLATQVMRSDAEVDATYPWVEAEIFDVVARQAPMARDLRFVMASSRVAANIERCGDLVASIARRAGRVELADVEGEPLAFIERMGADVSVAFDRAIAAYAALDADLAATVAPLDDAIDELHHGLLRCMVDSTADPEVAIEAAMVARFYERIGDHAVAVAERVRFVALGEMDPGDRDEQD